MSCQNCSIWCAQCTNATWCTSCLPSYVLQSWQCILNCTMTQYYNWTSTTCMNCSNFNANCNQCNSTQCLMCMPNYIMQNSNCVLFTAANCTAAQYFNPNPPSCVNCSTFNQWCTQCNMTSCLNCSANYTLYP